MSEPKGKKKAEEKEGIRRRLFIILMIAICAVGVIVEVGLLIHSRKKKSEPKTKPEETVTETPTPTVPQQEDEPEGRYVISKEYGWHYNEAIGRNGEFCIEYEYDKQGRETVSRTLDGEDVLVTYVTTYDRNGSKTEEWDPDCDGYLMRRLYLDQSGTVVRTLYQNIDGTGLEECEEEFDTAGNRIALKYVSDSGTTYYIRWEYDQLGRMIKRSESDDSDGAEKVYNYHEFLYDEENRIIRDTEYSLADGQFVMPWYTEYIYDGEQSGERFCYYDNGLLRTEESINIGTTPEHYLLKYENSFSVEYQYHIPKANYPKDFFTSIGFSYFCSGEEYNNGVKKTVKAIDFNEQGQAVRFYTVDGQEKTLNAECEYDENGRFSKMRVHLPADVSWPNDTDDTSPSEIVKEYTFTYDEMGNVTQLITEDLDTHAALTENYEWIFIPAIKD